MTIKAKVNRKGRLSRKLLWRLWKSLIFFLTFYVLTKVVMEKIGWITQLSKYLICLTFHRERASIRSWTAHSFNIDKQPPFAWCLHNNKSHGVLMENYFFSLLLNWIFYTHKGIEAVDENVNFLWGKIRIQ